MSYPGTTTSSPLGRSARRMRALESANAEPANQRQLASDGLQRMGIFGAGIALGALLGAGTALLLAPYSGQVTRRRLVRGAHRARSRAGNAWVDLGAELRVAGDRARRDLRRRSHRGRWAAEDLMDRRVALRRP